MKEHERIVEIAREELGYGEQPPGSNAGPHVAKYLGAEYKPGREWCAGFVSWCLEQAGFLAPMQGRARRGARALVRWVAEHGEWVVTPDQATSLRKNRNIIMHKGMPQPGDVICWKRSRIVPWHCHVAIIAEWLPDTGVFNIVEGNVGGRVCDAIIPIHQWARRMRGLYGIARPRPVPITVRSVAQADALLRKYYTSPREE